MKNTLVHDIESTGSFQRSYQNLSAPDNLEHLDVAEIHHKMMRQHLHHCTADVYCRLKLNAVFKVLTRNKEEKKDRKISFGDKTTATTITSNSWQRK